jgi:hypothetical protein
LVHADDDWEPPFDYSTMYVSNNILTSRDPTAFKELSYRGEGRRSVRDHRIGVSTADEKSVRVYLFDASYVDGLTIELRVNSEFESREAEMQALKYATIIGRLPTFFRSEVETITIHKAYFTYSAWDHDILLHSYYAEEDERTGHLEEVLIHETTHLTVDDPHKNMRAWYRAQESDGAFISTYAENHSKREDIAESFIFYFALEYFPDRLPGRIKDIVEATIPNRIEYFKNIVFDGLCPIVIEECPDDSGLRRTN